MLYKPSKVYSGALSGFEAQIIEVEADVSVGLNSFQIVGLPDKAIEEAKERISSAIKNLKLKHPRAFNKRVTVNLAPADIKKEGVLYDLPIAISFLLSSGQLKFDSKKYLFVGELGLEGRLRTVKNALSFAQLAKQKGIDWIILPAGNENEACLVKNVKIFAAENLLDIIDFLEKPETRTAIKSPALKIAELNLSPEPEIDMASISGQQTAKRALEIAAAGGHNVLMQGPPGSGKTILAKSLSGILPKMTDEEMIEVTRIYSMAGKINPERPLIADRPFRNPHHTSSGAAIVGGGQFLKPGEITLAHRGVLFLDEFPEFHRDVLEALRQPMESGSVTISRARGEVKFPAKFILVAAANPCPCGFYNDPEENCRCYGVQLQNYRKKLSGPIADRIDMHIEVPHQKYETLNSNTTEASSSLIRQKVEAARDVQRKRFADSGTNSNGEMTIKEVKAYCEIPGESEDILRNAVNKKRLSVRGYHKVLKLARTIADLDLRKKIMPQDIAEAIGYNRRAIGD